MDTTWPHNLVGFAKNEEVGEKVSGLTLIPNANEEGDLVFGDLEKQQSYQSSPGLCQGGRELSFGMQLQYIKLHNTYTWLGAVI